MWERELRKIKGLYDNRMKASQQKASKMEQALTNQTYQVCERKLLCRVLPQSTWRKCVRKWGWVFRTDLTESITDRRLYQIRGSKWKTDFEGENTTDK